MRLLNLSPFLLTYLHKISAHPRAHPQEDSNYYQPEVETPESLEDTYDESDYVESDYVEDVAPESASVGTVYKTINLGEELVLNCNNPNDLEVSRNSDEQSYIVWDYFKDQATYDNKQSTVIAISKSLHTNSKYVAHLQGQIKIDDNSSDGSTLVLKPNTVTASGIYVCAKVGGEPVYNVIDVKVIKDPEVYLNHSQLVADTETNTVSCEAKNAFPMPYVSIQIGNQAREVQQNPSQDPVTGLWTVTVEDTFSIASDVRTIDFTCEISSNDNAYDMQSITKTSNVNFKPTDPIFSQTQLEQSQSPQEVRCSAESYPSHTTEWQGLEENFDASTYTFGENNQSIIFNNVTIDTHNNKTLTCLVSNDYGRAQNSMSITVVMPVAQSQSSSMGSTTILIIGIVIGVIVLSIIGFIVFAKRNKQGSEYQTNEGDKDGGAGPEGVDYEQNPEREALTKEDEQAHSKELMM